MIEILNIKKSFEELQVLKGVSFRADESDVVVVIGPSGSGKSTMLRCIIELERADDGDIKIDGKYICTDGKYKSESKIREIRKEMGMVFQDFNLFPHMTVKENLCCAPLLNSKETKEEIESRAVKNLKRVGLLEKSDVFPSKLSGGQKQRVAIARALMLNPKVMLFDEPTSSLDPELTKEVLTVIKDLAKEKMTMIIVTHEIGLAKELATKVIFMDKGLILDQGTAEEIIDNRKNERIKEFLDTVL